MSGDADARESDTPRSDRPLFGLGTSLLVAAALACPFAFMTATTLEPFPAVIFPGGGALAARLSDDEVTFYNTSLIAARDDGTEVVLDVATFLDPIPSSYLSGLLDTRFGQDRSPTTPVTFRKPDITVEFRRTVPDPADQLIGREWLRGNLRSMGLDPDVLVSREEILTVDHSSGSLLRRETVEEVTLLD